MELTLYYFPLRARAEPIRMMFFYGNIPFSDVIIPMTEWKGIKEQGELAPFGQLPCLRLPNGEIIAQSGAIARFAAKLARLYPEDAVAAAKADMIFEFAQELNMINPLLNFWPVTTDMWKNNYESFFNALPHHLEAADKLLGRGPFFGGPSPHYGDIAMFHILDSCFTMEPSCLDKHPRLKQFVEAVSGLPGVSHYLEVRLPPQKVGLCGSFMQAEIAKVYHHPRN
eukprot:gene9266-10230_t